VYVLVTQSRAEVLEPDDCTRLEVRIEAPDNAAAATLNDSDLGAWDGSGQVVLDVAGLRAHAAAGPVAPDWPQRWDAMLSYAADKGWLTEDGGGVRAHITAGSGE
jgi:hypothetical protein